MVKFDWLSTWNTAFLFFPRCDLVMETDWLFSSEGHRWPSAVKWAFINRSVIFPLLRSNTSVHQMDTNPFRHPSIQSQPTTLIATANQSISDEFIIIWKYFKQPQPIIYFICSASNQSGPHFWIMWGDEQTVLKLKRTFKLQHLGPFFKWIPESQRGMTFDKHILWACDLNRPCDIKWNINPSCTSHVQCEALEFRELLGRFEESAHISCHTAKPLLQRACTYHASLH